MLGEKCETSEIMAANKLDRARRLLLRAVDLVSDDDAATNRESSTASSSGVH